MPEPFLLSSIIWYGCWSKRWLFKSEAKRLLEYERKIFEYFENHLIISEQDRDFILHPNRNKIHCVPNGISTNFFEAIEVKKEFDLVFVGNLSYPPNIEAIEYIIQHILPLNPKLKILISGANPSKKLIKVAGKLRNRLQAFFAVAASLLGTISHRGWIDERQTDKYNYRKIHQARGGGEYFQSIRPRL